MEKKCVLFIFTDPSKVVPHKLYYVDGHTWEDDKTKARIFNTVHDAYQKQLEVKDFDLQLEEA